MPSTSGKKRRNLMKAKAKKALKSAVKKESQFMKALPQIREEDLLAFQFSHFDDDSKPEKWFVTPEEAVNFEPEYEDLLGYYEDGVKRTLTDEEIAVFRRKELWEADRLELEQANSVGGFEGEEDLEEHQRNGARSPSSDVSSLEDELISQAAREKIQRRQSRPQRPGSLPREPSQSSRSHTVISADSNKRKRSHEVPYDERNKRNWETFIVEDDPIEGSLTHRRMARELDNLQEETIEMDY